MERLDHAARSPDGEWLAAVVQRPALPGEVYGRNAYETDPSRSDTWLISTHTGERRAITNGAPQAAGYWCATWSPDGQRLALLSTQPEHGEPRGGDNVRLYVWDRATGSLVRASNDALMTQTRYGSGLDKLDLRGGGDSGTIAHTCNGYDENAPFLWLDDRRLLMVTKPKGQVSALIEQYGLPSREAGRDAQRLRVGVEPTGRAVGSGDAKVRCDQEANSAVLRMVDVVTRAVQTVARVPTYPFRGELTLSVSPDGRQLALLATLGALEPTAGRRLPNVSDDAWTVERRLGFISLATDAPIRWAILPTEGRYPLELYDWSPDGRFVALRGRAGPFEQATPLFVVSAKHGKAMRIGVGSIGDRMAGLQYRHERPVAWVDNRQLLARLRPSAPNAQADWWLLDINGKADNVTRGVKPFPESFRRSADGSLVAMSDGTLFRFDQARRALVPIAPVGGNASIVWPDDPRRPTNQLLIMVDRDDGRRGIRTLSSSTGQTGRIFELPLAARHLDFDSKSDWFVWSESGQEGISLRVTDLADGQSRDLLGLDTELAAIEWGRTLLIDYQGTDGQPLKGAVILPPDYQPGRRYPTLLWVYPGHRVQGLETEYFLDPYLPGIYNLHLYAARGYVVLVPSMPLPPSAKRNDVYSEVPKGVLPALDKLVALGIADPDRLGVMGQSFGGYGVYALVSQTDRFKAGVAMAGITDLAGYYGQFDPLARGYPGIEHEMSDNWAMMDLFGRQVPPERDPDGYARNSPLTYVDKVHTPLLMIHGEYDVRASSVQAEEFFYGLYAQGKTARLLRYGGEGHALAQSPANVRDVFEQTVGWFDRYLQERPKATEAVKPKS